MGISIPPCNTSRKCEVASLRMGTIGMTPAVERLISRLARQLMIRQGPIWTGSEARTVVAAALTALAMNVPPAEFRRLVAATYRVGRALDPIHRLSRSVPWDKLQLQAAIRDSVAHHFESPVSDAFVEDLAGRLKSCDLSAPLSLDLVAITNASLRATGQSEPARGLQSKLAVAEFMQALLDERLTSLVARVEAELDVAESDVAGSLLLALEEDARDGDAAVALAPAPSSATQRLSSHETQSLILLADPRVRDEFRDWIEELAPVAQRSLHRRLLLLVVEPLSYRLWVKHIVGARTSRLKELKVIAADTHFRVLFYADPGTRPSVLSFGFRRDLRQLIVRADSLMDGTR